MTTYRSPREYAWAAWLDCLQVPYQYEALQARLSRALRYQPDFWLPNTEAWLEIKAARPTYGEARVAKQVTRAVLPMKVDPDSDAEAATLPDHLQVICRIIEPIYVGKPVQNSSIKQPGSSPDDTLYSTPASAASFLRARPTVTSASMLTSTTSLP